MNKRTISWAEYQGLVGKLARDISVSGWTPDYIVGITRGGCLPAVMLSHYFDIPMHTLEVKLRDHANTESNLWMSEDAYNGKNILVVDDINDTGATINWIIQDWQSSCHPSDAHWLNVWNNTVKFAVIADNLASQCGVEMDYAGFEVNKEEENTWLDFPYEDWWTK